MPKPDTRAQLEAALASCLIGVVRGHWDSLDIVATTTVSKQSRMVQLGVIARGLVIAAIPVGALWAGKSAGVLLPGPVHDYLIAGALVWAVINVLTALDPRLSEKVEALGKIATILPFGKPRAE